MKTTDNIKLEKYKLFSESSVVFIVILRKWEIKKANYDKAMNLESMWENEISNFP
jgi:hypothetical protein